MHKVRAVKRLMTERIAMRMLFGRDSRDSTAAESCLQKVLSLKCAHMARVFGASFEEYVGGSPRHAAPEDSPKPQS